MKFDSDSVLIVKYDKEWLRILFGYKNMKDNIYVPIKIKGLSIRE